MLPSHALVPTPLGDDEGVGVGVPATVDRVVHAADHRLDTDALLADFWVDQVHRKVASVGVRAQKCLHLLADAHGLLDDGILFTLGKRVVLRLGAQVVGEAQGTGQVLQVQSGGQRGVGKLLDRRCSGGGGGVVVGVVLALAERDGRGKRKRRHAGKGL